MKRGLTLYAIAAYAFLHVPLLILGAFSFNSSKFTVWQGFSPSLAGSMYLSLVTPEIVTGVSLLALFQWVFRFLNLRLGMHTVILAHVGFSLAYVVVVVMARLRSFDPALEEAAMDLGATGF